MPLFALVAKLPGLLTDQLGDDLSSFFVTGSSLNPAPPLQLKQSRGMPEVHPHLHVEGQRGLNPCVDLPFFLLTINTVRAALLSA
jgi:hypothetical protein